MEAPGPGIEPLPQQRQCWILKPLSHRGTHFYFASSAINSHGITEILDVITSCFSRDVSLKRKLLGCGMWPRLPEGAAVCFPAGPHQRGPSFSEGWRETVISLVRLKFPGSSWSAESPALDLRGIQAPQAGSGAWRSALGSSLLLSVLMRGPLPPPEHPTLMK